ncbi:MAG: deoxyribonuclease [Fimbriimonadaceae bacterium]|jgi:deoxyribonuclease-4|nr:deoxyribonuclease [Fimbriimonadaceae bacterium]
MPTSGGLGNALRKGKEIGCTAVQVFTSSPQTWKTGPITQEKVDDFKKAQQETGIMEVVTHDSYLINLCAPDPAMRQKSIEGLTNELLRSHLYGIHYVVSHMGSHVGQDLEVALRAVAEAAEQVLDNSPDDVMLLMETTAGQGSALNARFEELAILIELLDGHPRVGVCLDTCHVFVAGYDIRDEESFQRTFHEFNRLIGFDRLKAVHCNDSKRGLGSKVDRHEHIGKGELGPKTFEMLLNDPRFEKIPIMIETADPDEMHEVNLKVLRSYVHQPDPAR